MGNMGGIAAGKGDPYGDFGPAGKSLSDGVRFLDGGDGFEGEKIEDLRLGGAGEDLDPLTVELDKIGMGAAVIAVILRAIVESGAVGSERAGD